MATAMVAMAACAPAVQKSENPRDEPTTSVHTSEAPTTAPPTDPVSDGSVPPDTVSPVPESSVREPPTTRARPTTVPEPIAAPPATQPLPLIDDRRVAVVSFYGDELAGNLTANGEVFDPGALTFAHRSMAFGTRVEFCAALGCVVARCNDRGPFIGGRSFDLSEATFASIADTRAGVVEVLWRFV